MSAKTTAYSPVLLTSRLASAAATGASVLRHQAAVNSGAAKSIHPSLDPKKRNKAGSIVRECFDSPVFPESRAVAVILDGTGSMRDYPREIINQLPALMTVLVKDGFIKYPQVCFGQICDHADDYVYQIGHFEGDNTLDNSLADMITHPNGNAGGGSASAHEAYLIPLWHFAYNSDLDCVKKRGEKGFLFIIGDELPNDILTPEQVEAVFDVKIEAPLTKEEILAKLYESYELFWINPKGSSHGKDQYVIKPMEALLKPGHYIRPETEGVGGICQLIAAQIALYEGLDHAAVIQSISAHVDPKTAAAFAKALVVTNPGKLQSVPGNSGLVTLDTSTPTPRL